VEIEIPNEDKKAKRIKANITTVMKNISGFFKGPEYIDL
jgi:CRISPR/Cas system-associated protein Cas7 (RAMP superfamily)